MTAIDSPLANLLRSYLHQDYDLEYAGIEDALRAYRREAGADERRRVLDEIAMLLETHADDAGLHRALRARGFIFYPPRTGETTRAWLLRASRLLDVEDAEKDGDR